MTKAELPSNEFCQRLTIDIGHEFDRRGYKIQRVCRYPTEVVFEYDDNNHERKSLRVPLDHSQLDFTIDALIHSKRAVYGL